jgi:signal transduction histidine kinase
MPGKTGRVQNRRSRFKLTLVLAVLLPVLASSITQAVPWLGQFPFALQIVVVVSLAIFGDVAPALLAVLCAALSRYAVEAIVFRHIAISSGDEIRLALLLVLALIVGLASRSRRRALETLEGTLDALHDRTDALIDSLHGSKCASWIIDLSFGQSVRWYSGSFQIFGRPFSELESLPSLLRFLHSDDQPRLESLREHMKTSWEPLLFEHRVLWPSGELHSLEMHGTRVPSQSCVWRGVTFDITERRHAEGALIRAEKLAAMGRLASTVAHEINNPLEAVTNLLYLARSDESLAPATNEYLGTAEKELARLADITRLTLGFVRTGALARPLKMAGIVEEVLAIFRHRLESRTIEVERHFQAGVTITIAPHELRQIVTNLIANAADASNGSAPRIAIHILAETSPATPAHAATHNAVLLIQDNGSGIAANQLPHLFEPFFTTKADVGTGIGLWVTRDLVEKNAGRISIQLKDLPDAMKTCFRIEFPFSTGNPPPPAVS